MTNKTDKQFLFETNLNWLSEDRGIMYARGTSGPIYTTTPVEFGGSGKEWTPEHLLLSAVISCYMATFIGFAKKAKLSFTRLECNAIGQVKIAEGKYKFTRIDVYPKIFMEEGLPFETANSVVQKTQHYCLISNSINAEFIYHAEILKENHPVKFQTAGFY